MYILNNAYPIVHIGYYGSFKYRGVHLSKKKFLLFFDHNYVTFFSYMGSLDIKKQPNGRSILYLSFMWRRPLIVVDANKYTILSSPYGESVSPPLQPYAEAFAPMPVHYH